MHWGHHWHTLHLLGHPSSFSLKGLLASLAWTLMWGVVHCLLACTHPRVHGNPLQWPELLRLHWVSEDLCRPRNILIMAQNTKPNMHGATSQLRKQKRKENITPFSVTLMRSQVPGCPGNWESIHAPQLAWIPNTSHHFACSGGLPRWDEEVSVLV